MTTSQPVEIELKLALLPQRVAAFTKLMARQRNAPVQQELVTRYFDTPDFSLSALGVAVRVRRAGRHWLQTLKTEGERHGGLSRRAESEMAISRSKPDWEKFPPEARALVPEALRAQLEVVFETRFNRTAWLIDSRGGTEIEVALDVGEVRAGRRSQPNLRDRARNSGHVNRYLVCTGAWTGLGGFDCVPLDDSKCRRGVRLARGEEATPAKSVPLALDSGMSVEDGYLPRSARPAWRSSSHLPVGAGIRRYRVRAPGAGGAAAPARGAAAIPAGVPLLPVRLLAELRALAAPSVPHGDWDVLCSETCRPLCRITPDAAAWQRGWQALEARRAGVRAPADGAHAGAPGCVAAGIPALAAAAAAGAPPPKRSASSSYRH